MNYAWPYGLNNALTTGAPRRYPSLDVAQAGYGYRGHDVWRDEYGALNHGGPDSRLFKTDLVRGQIDQERAAMAEEEQMRGADFQQPAQSYVNYDVPTPRVIHPAPARSQMPISRSRGSRLGTPRVDYTAPSSFRQPAQSYETTQMRTPRVDHVASSSSRYPAQSYTNYQSQRPALTRSIPPSPQLSIHSNERDRPQAQQSIITGSLLPEALQATAAIRYDMGDGQMIPTVVLTGSLGTSITASDESRRVEICIFPLTFKRIQIRFDNLSRMMVNVPNITFRELRTRLHDGRQGHPPSLKLFCWFAHPESGGWQHRNFEMGDMVWAKLSSRATPEMHLIVVKYRN